jgi:hypothetical protein
MTEDELMKVMDKAMELRRQYPDWRAGQAYFNALYTILPDVAEEIRGTPLDPFHRKPTDSLADFLDELVRRVDG